MSVRIASVDKITFLTCVKHNLWGANNIYINSWDIGDTLVFKVGNHLVATAKIAGNSYMDDTVIWKNGLFWNRIPLQFEYILDSDNYIPFDGEILDKFLTRWGKKYGWVILNKSPLPEDISDFILNLFYTRKNDSSTIKNKIDTLINEAI